MKKGLLWVMVAAPLVFGACGANIDDGTGMNAEPASGEDAVLGGEASAVAIAGGGSLATDNMNSAITEKLALKLEEQLNDMLANGELEIPEDEAEVAKDVRVGFDLFKGFTLIVQDEAVPFAGGEMLLNGQLSVKLRLRGAGTIALEMNGELISTLQDVKREGDVEGIPYSLALNGDNKLGIDGAFSVTIKKWKVSAMSAELTSGIKESDVKAIGTVGDRSVVGAVDMMDVSIQVKYPDILKAPKDIDIICNGEISISVNENVISSCTLAEECNACK